MVDVNKPVAQILESAQDAGAAVSMSLASFTMPDLSLANIISGVASLAMVFGGVFPFIPQYRDIHRSQNAEGFSLFVCLTLLIANILRILFCPILGVDFLVSQDDARKLSTQLITTGNRLKFGKQFELPLLAQSVIMTFTMMALVHLCVSVKHKTEIIKSRNHQFTDFELEHFWKWTDFHSYVQFISAFTCVVGLLTYIFINNWVYIETLGFLAVFAEAMLGAPQFYRNFQNKSTQGMSKKMVGMWTCGDIFKTCYFIIREAPAQFWICGSLQVLIDISIFIQVFMYRNLVPKAAFS